MNNRTNLWTIAPAGTDVDIKPRLAAVSLTDYNWNGGSVLEDDAGTYLVGIILELSNTGGAVTLCCFELAPQTDGTYALDWNKPVHEQLEYNEGQRLYAVRKSWLSHQSPAALDSPVT